MEMRYFKHFESAYRITNKPEDTRLIIASDNVISNGIIEGLTLFLVDMSDPKPVIQEAAQAYLVENNKECVITKLLVGFYKCNP